MEKLLTVKDVELKALTLMQPATIGYYQSGADEETTLRDNKEAFDRFLLLPRMLRNVSQLNLTVTSFGGEFSLPFAFAPTAMHKLAHPSGECATATVAFQRNMLMILSTLSTTSLENVASAGNKKQNLWFQLYVYKDRKLTETMIKRVEKAGYSAIVLTVDAPFFGRRLADCRNKFSLPPGLKLANFQGLNESDIPSAPPANTDESGLFLYIMKQFDQTLTWDIIYWIRKISKLPIIVKGILAPEDAEIALSYNVDGIIVSNHGGRQVDGVPNTIEVLEEVCDQVKGRCPVFLDGGIRKGTDILKALSLGAKMVFIGRPVLYGLAVGGESGLNHVVDILKGELERAMALVGCTDVNRVPKSLTIRRKAFHSTL